MDGHSEHHHSLPGPSRSPAGVAFIAFLVALGAVVLRQAQNAWRPPHAMKTSLAWEVNVARIAASRRRTAVRSMRASRRLARSSQIVIHTLPVVTTSSREREAKAEALVLTQN
jgi:hypothetical protein